MDDKKENTEVVTTESYETDEFELSQEMEEELSNGLGPDE